MSVSTAIWSERPLEERVVHYIAFAAFTTHDPVTSVHASHSAIGLDRHIRGALIRVYPQWPMCSKESHTDSFFSSSLFNAVPDKLAVGISLNPR
jgi:hypothetical protein